MSGFQIGTIFIPGPSRPPEDTRSTEQKLHDAEATIRIWRQEILRFSEEKRDEIRKLRGAIEAVIDTWEHPGPMGTLYEMPLAIGYAKIALDRTD